jgi:hypothetical protein
VTGVVCNSTFIILNIQRMKQYKEFLI